MSAPGERSLAVGESKHICVFSLLTRPSCFSGNLREQRYQQVDEEFMKSDHPAVVRTRPTIPGLNNTRLPPSSPTLYTAVHQNGGENDYIIPLPDPKPDAICDLPQEASVSRAR